MRTVGLTGGIAAGKSTVAKLLRARGVPVIDADQVSRDVVAPGSPALSAIVARFGPAVLQPDGALDRKALGACIIADPAARADLEAITHPAIRAAIAEQLAGFAAAGQHIDAVVGMESRGFLFGAPLAMELSAAFVPARKPGKLPYHSVGVEYDLEYGSARLEMHIDAIKPGQRVLIVDDLLATGGTAMATAPSSSRASWPAKASTNPPPPAGSTPSSPSTPRSESPPPSSGTTRTRRPWRPRPTGPGPRSWLR